mmetsp:Transcript_8301/g.7350  ORF Transcript_8301/g.7350 Transcript_8301/m.7350 type:complete len:159 (-) Transcript_8301:23-499(-)
MPFKETLIGLTSQSPSHIPASTIYNKGDASKGFMFNAGKAKKTAFETPKILKPPKLEVERRKSKIIHKDFNLEKKEINKYFISSRDRAKIFAQGIKKPKVMNTKSPKKRQHLKMMDAELNTIKDEAELEDMSSVKSNRRCIINPNKMKLAEQTIRMLF